MNKLFQVSLLMLCVLFVNISNTKADDKYSPKLKIKDGKNLSDLSLTSYSKDKINIDYEKAKKYYMAKTGSILGASVDFQIGYGTTNANVTAQSSAKDVTTTSKGGITFGALLNISLFDLFNLTTGLDFTKKNFDVAVPYSAPSIGTGDSIVKNLANNYMNIPLNINLSGKLSDNVGISFSGGPYFGFLLNPTNEVSGYKDFDFGLNGILTGNYLLNQFVSIILGTEVQYGGLNNLINTNTVESARTINWNAFTGLRVGFDL